MTKIKTTPILGAELQIGDQIVRKGAVEYTVVALTPGTGQSFYIQIEDGTSIPCDMTTKLRKAT